MQKYTVILLENDRSPDIDMDTNYVIYFHIDSCFIQL